MTTPGQDEERATAEAARWLVVLEEAPEDAALRARFQAWLSASPANAAAWADTSDLYDLMAQVPPAHAAHWTPRSAKGERSSAATAPSGPARALRGRRPAAVGLATVGRATVGLATAALAACLALFVLPAVRLALEADYVTATAEQQALRLEDGSSVWLGPDSALAVDFSEGERRVRLLKGEAFFEVTADPDRVFQVAAGTLRTTVLGTAFDVRFGEEGGAVAVRHGQVRVDYDEALPPVSERLEAGDWLRVGWDGRVERGDLPPDEVASWRHGQIVARDRPLRDVVDELRRSYGGVILLADSALGRRRVTGVYNVSDPAEALQALAGAHGGSVRRLSPWLLVVSGG